MLNMDPPKKLKGKARDLFLFETQRKWVEECKKNGVSYSGPNGRAIFEADMAELKRLESRVRGHGLTA